MSARRREEIERTMRLVRRAAAGLAAGVLAAAAGCAGTPIRTDQKYFASPEEAFSAFAAATRAADRPALDAILGNDAKALLDSGDPVADRESLERFAASYDEAHEIQWSSDEQAELVTGKDEWPFPIPVVQEKPGWRFDTETGDEEILARRIGRNERFAIQACLAYVDAQREYWERNPDGAPLLHYARRLISSEGKRDGLYYATADDEEPSPLGDGFARATAAGYEFGKASGPTPFHGYIYRSIEAQGPHARDGAYGYVVGERMIGGFALLAYPATYDNSGLMTFLVNQDGVVYQKDLGPETEKLAPTIRIFDPDESWTRVPEEDLAPPIETAGSE